MEIITILAGIGWAIFVIDMLFSFYNVDNREINPALGTIYWVVGIIAVAICLTIGGLIGYIILSPFLKMLGIEWFIIPNF